MPTYARKNSGAAPLRQAGRQVRQTAVNYSGSARPSLDKTTGGLTYPSSSTRVPQKKARLPLSNAEVKTPLRPASSPGAPAPSPGVAGRPQPIQVMDRPFAMGEAQYRAGFPRLAPMAPGGAMMPQQPELAMRQPSYTKKIGTGSTLMPPSRPGSSGGPPMKPAIPEGKRFGAADVAKVLTSRRSGLPITPPSGGTPYGKALYTPPTDVIEMSRGDAFDPYGRLQGGRIGGMTATPLMLEGEEEGGSDQVLNSGGSGTGGVGTTVIGKDDTYNPTVSIGPFRGGMSEPASNEEQYPQSGNPVTGITLEEPGARPPGIPDGGDSRGPGYDFGKFIAQFFDPFIGTADEYNKKIKPGLTEYYDNWQDMADQGNYARGLLDPAVQAEQEAAAREQMHQDVNQQRDEALRAQISRMNRGGAVGTGTEQGIYGDAAQALAEGNRGLTMDAFTRKLQAGGLGSGVLNDLAGMKYGLLSGERMNPETLMALAAYLGGELAPDDLGLINLQV